MKKSHLIAVSFTALIVLWMGAGMVFGSKEPENKAALEEKAEAAKNVVVEVRDLTAAPVVSYIVSQGHVMPDREVILRSEIAARVTEILIAEGQTVSEGDVIAKLSVDDRQAQLDKAKAKTAEASSKYNSLKNLTEKGYASQNRKDEALAVLRAAQAEQKQLALQIEHTDIKAPFDGIIAAQHVEQGDYVTIGGEMIAVVDNDPLVVTAYIPQHEVSTIQKEEPVQVLLATGENKEGTIRFVAPRAEQATRTFRIEIAIPNPNGLPSGVSATARIPKKSVMAHFVSPALLTLDDTGATGIKAVNENSIVEFYPVEIINAKPDGVYVTGLPQQARVITNGQGFVTANDNVSFVYEKAKEQSNDTPMVNKTPEQPELSKLEASHENN